MRTRWIVITGLVFVLVGVGYYLSENTSGRIPVRLSQFGYGITFPGQLLVASIRGNIHAFFGDWRDPVLKIGASFFVWFGASLMAAKMIARFKAGSDRVSP